MISKERRKYLNSMHDDLVKHIDELGKKSNREIVFLCHYSKDLVSAIMTLEDGLPVDACGFHEAFGCIPEAFRKEQLTIEEARWIMGQLQVVAAGRIINIINRTGPIRGEMTLADMEPASPHMN